MSRLVGISNRVGPLSDEGKAGGLAVGLADALRQRGGIWFGWSGRTTAEGTFGPLHLTSEGDVQLATIDMTESEIEEFYTGHANQALWPVLHYRVDLATFDRRFANAYRHVNERMGERLRPLLRPSDLVWVHDYHFIPLGAEIRAGGFDGLIGFFLHVPFPAPEIASTIPGAHSLFGSMLAYDVVGFQTARDRDNFCRFAVSECGADVDGAHLVLNGRRTRAEVFPIGIDADRFAEFAVSPEALRRQAQVRTALRDRHMIIGVDRLDYSKGIPERLRAFERLLMDHPDNCGKVSLLQVAPISRAEVNAYCELRRELEELAGRINGAFAQLDWIPVRMMTRGFTRKSLAGLYRASRACLVTPLRDGMNLVAKEFVAAQNPKDPGVLVLSRFAGAADYLAEALIVNPHDPADVSEALQRALHMPAEERQERWNALNEKIRSGTAARWCESFLSALEQARAAEPAGGDLDVPDYDVAGTNVVRVPRFRASSGDGAAPRAGPDGAGSGRAL